MRNIAAISIVVFGITLLPALAQGIYVGPNGVGVDPGIGRDRGYDRGDREYRDDQDDRRRAYFERRRREEARERYRRHHDDYDDR